MDEELNAAALEVQRLASEAQAELMRLIVATDAVLSVQQVKTIQQRFNAAFVNLMVARLNAVPATGPRDVWDVRMVKEMRVGDVSLSQRLYTNASQTAHQVVALVKEHAQGKMQARELAIRLYDGYNPKDGIKRPLEGAARAKLPHALRQLTANPADRAALQQVFEQGQRYAQSLKTEPLKAAYLQALKAWEKGKGAAALEHGLEVAHKEKTRYMANRIAQTELARAHQNAVAQTLMEDETISVVQVQMSAAHPVFDVCDMHSKADLFHLGPGCYPKEKAPKPPWHPHCRCRLRSRPSLSAAMAREKPGGEVAYLRSLPVNDAIKIAGSRARLQRLLNGEHFDDVVNDGRDALYRLERLGQIKAAAPNAIATAIPPGIINPVATFQEQKTVKAAAKWAVDNNLADFADYTGIKPEVANAWNKSLYDHLQEFPELRKDMKFTGTGQAQFARWREIEIQRYIARMQSANPHMPGHDFRPHAEKTVLIKKVGNQYAHFWSQPDVRGVTVNRKYGADSVNFEKSIVNCATSGHFPPSNTTIKSVADHEMGHALDHHLRLEIDADVIQAYNEAALKGMKNEVSGYASTNIKEFIAECWSESINSSAPRAFAQKIAAIVRNRYRAKYP